MAILPLIILLFLLLVLPGFFLLIGGLVGRQLFTEPRCRRCGYDVRKSWTGDQDEARPCPECGADLTVPKAVRFGKRQRRLWMIITGAAIMTLVVAAMMIVPMFIWPRSVRPRTQSNTALIATLATTADNSRVWRELRNRLSTGRLSAKEVDQAIGQLTRHLQAQRASGQRVGYPHGAEDFIGLAVQTQSISAGQFQEFFGEFFEAYYKDVPSLRRIHKSVRQGKRVRFDLGQRHLRRLDGIRLVYALRQVTIAGKPVKVAKRNRNEMFHPDELSGYDNREPDNLALQLDLPPGEYEVKFEFDLGVLPSTSPLVGMGGKAGQKQRWQNPLCTWTTTRSSKLHIVRADESPITLITDAALSPGGPGGLTVERAYTVPLPKGVRIKVQLARKSPPPTPYCFGMKVRVLDREYTPTRNRKFGASAGWGLNSGEQRIDLPGPLPAEVDRITVILEPDPLYAEQWPELDRIWGEPITFKDVPLDRHDLD